MSDKTNYPVVLALGYFDSVHKGHKKVIDSAKERADKIGAKLVVVTFGGNLKALTSNAKEKVVYTATEREKLYRDLGVDEVYFAPTDKEFLAMSGVEFLDLLNAKYQVDSYFSGEDYRFGKSGVCTVNDLSTYAENKGQGCFIVQLMTFDGEKISTTAVKERLTNGDLKGANYMLGRPYSVTGVVFEDRKVGKTLGFPTVNLKLDKRKHHIKDGVYFGRTEVFGKTYKAIINYGARPTFDLTEKLVEAHLVDFDGELYGMELTLYFDDYMRDIIKFSNAEELKEQLKIDLKIAKEKNYD
jgi:riboflavin kinase/FMN adenylyltransferase